jgi:phosphatidylinositol-3-phosphatase
VRDTPDGDVSSWLRSIRLSRLQLAMVAMLSALATALIIAGALGRTPAQTAALAALRTRPTVIHAAGPEPARQDAAPAPQPTVQPTPTPAAPAPAAPQSSPTQSQPTTTAAATQTTATSTTPSSTPTTTKTKASPVKHVFVIALSTTSYDAAFGRGSVARYLNDQLRPKGTLLSGYTTLGGAELPDYLAMIGGQAPNADTRANCPSYDEFPSSAKPNKSGQVPGTGCIYPNTALTIGDQVTASGHVWKAYIDDMGATACVHPNSNALDNAPLPGAGSDYDTRHNPFIYFHSLLDLGDCASDDVTLTKLPAALSSSAKTSRYAFIAPGACEDASQATCPDGDAAGLAGEDAFLKTWVPKILHSRAYKKNGVLIIAFAHAAATSPTAGAGATGSTDSAGPVRTGALIISRYAHAGKTVAKAYNPYSILRSVEDLLGLQPLLAHAKAAKSFVAAALPGA